jgi:hypothetical protein
MDNNTRIPEEPITLKDLEQTYRAADPVFYPVPESMGYTDISGLPIVGGLQDLIPDPALNNIEKRGPDFYHDQIKKNSEIFSSNLSATVGGKKTINNSPFPSEETVKEIKAKLEEARKEAKLIQDKIDLKKMNSVVPSFTIDPNHILNNSTSTPALIRKISSKHLVNDLIMLKVVQPHELQNQILLCEKWNDNDFSTCRRLIDYGATAEEFQRHLTTANAWASETFKTALKEFAEKSLEASKISPTKLSVTDGATSITIGPRTYGVYSTNSVQERAVLVSDMLGSKFISEEKLKQISTPELTKEIIKAGVDLHRQTFPVKTSANWDIEKVNSIIDNYDVTPDELEKFVTLGVLTSSELANWRIAHQKDNNYFYNEDFSEAPEEKKLDFFDGLKSDATKAGIRIVGKQAVDATKHLMLKALPEDKLLSMRSFLETELGTSLIGMMAGVALTYGMENNDKAQMIAKELRVASLSTIGNEAINSLTEAMGAAVTKAIQDIPDEVSEVAAEAEFAEDQSLLLSHKFEDLEDGSIKEKFRRNSV